MSLLLPSSSQGASSPLREPLLEGGERPPLMASTGGVGRQGQGGLLPRVLRKYPLAYTATISLGNKEAGSMLVDVGLVPGRQQLLSVRRAEGPAGAVHVGDWVTHVNGKRVRSEEEWAAALGAAASCQKQHQQPQQEQQPRRIPATEEEEEGAAGVCVLELRLLRLHHAHVEEAAAHPPPASAATGLHTLHRGPAVLTAPASPPAADSVLGMLLAGGGCLLGALAPAAGAAGGARRARARSWSSGSSGEYSEVEFGGEKEEDGGAAAMMMDDDALLLAAAAEPLPPLPPYARWAHEPGAAAALDAAVQRLSLPAFPFLWYEVGSAEEARAGLPALARRFGLAVDALRRDNRGVCPVGEPARLRPGLLLRLRNAEYDPKAAALGAVEAACYRPPPSSVGADRCTEAAVAWSSGKGDGLGSRRGSFAGTASVTSSSGSSSSGGGSIYGSGAGGRGLLFPLVDAVGVGGVGDPHGRHDGFV